MKNITRRILIFCIYSLSLQCWSKPIDFNRDIRLILADHCFACHGPDQNKREGGKGKANGLRLDIATGAKADLGGYAAVVPGQPEHSALIARIMANDDSIMPPRNFHKALSLEQKQLLKRWVSQGAPYDQHWAFILPKRSIPPKILPKHRNSVSNWIDPYIISKLESFGLSPSPEANRHTLIRRLSFDIIGLPPSTQELRMFLTDNTSTAYEKVVDRLLKSSHFGERMATYWLDLVRYADTNGYHADLTWNVWPYRDYVIKAFNDNMPFGQFTLEQLAGDLIPNATLSQKVAAGYNRLNMKSTEFGIQDKEYLAKYAADRVRTTSGTWMGVTMGCAECHDHKFDPFTAKDFYSFSAFFADIKQKGYYPDAQKVGWGETLKLPSSRNKSHIEELESKRNKIIGEMDALVDTLKANVDADEHPVDWQILEPITYIATNNITQLKKLDDNSILASGDTSARNDYIVTARNDVKGITGFRIEVLPDPSLPQGGPGRADNGNFVITEFKVGTCNDTTKIPLMTIPLSHASATFEQLLATEQNPYKTWNAASAIDNNIHGEDLGWAILPQVGQTNSAVFETVENVSSKGILTFTIEQHHHHHQLGRFRLSVTTNQSPSKHYILAMLNKSIDKCTTEERIHLVKYFLDVTEFKLLNDQLSQIEAKLVIAHQAVPTMLATISVEPMTTRVLPRGNWMDNSGEIVQPSIPEFMGGTQSANRLTRLDLANWLISHDNPLTARVFVNRLWKLFFGTGLSRVLDDVGTQGEVPSHPELIDRLALEFMDSGWDVKHVIKLMVMSKTYRQSSMPRPELEDWDPYNRFLARQARFRLEAEMIRDNALAVGGLLTTKIGGPSTKPYQPEGYWDHLYFPQRDYQHDEGENQYRRGIYTHWQRQFLHPALKIFDAPSREECTAERSRSSTPLGALALLNDPSQVEAARVLATRVVKEGGNSIDARLQWLGMRTLSRQFNNDELITLKGLLTKHQIHYEMHPSAAEKLMRTGLHPTTSSKNAAVLASWTSTVRAVLNMHEMITRY